MSNPGGQNPIIHDQAIPRDWTAFCAFIERNYRVIYTVALAHVRDADTAQEITQDVCVRLLLKRDQLPVSANPSGWLARVARNTAIDWIRRRQTHSRILATMESWNQNPIAGKNTPQDARTAAIMEEEKQRLYIALEHIAPEDREMLLMHYLDGVEKQDIARLLEVHPSTVGRRIDKALSKLKKSMTEFEPARLRSLRPAEHTSRGVLATLAAVATLGAAEEAALAAVAAPLPVLSVGGSGASAGGAIKGALAQVTCRVKDLSSGWGVPIAIGAVAVITVAAISATRFYGLDNTPPAGTMVSAIKGENAPGLSVEANKAPFAKVRKPRQSASRLVNGLTSMGAGVTGYLPVGATDGETLEGTVRTEDGEPISGAAVIFWSSNDSGETSITVNSDGNGRYVFRNLKASVPKGQLRSGYITATADGFAHAARGEYEVYLPLPSVHVDLDVVLTKPVELKGIIVDESGEAVAGAKVHVTAEYSEQQMLYKDEPGASLFMASTDQGGIFHFPELKAGYINLLV